MIARKGEYEGSKELFADLATEFSALNLAYMHLMLGPSSTSVDQVLTIYHRILWLWLDLFVKG